MFAAIIITVLSCFSIVHCGLLASEHEVDFNSYNNNKGSYGSQAELSSLAHTAAIQAKNALQNQHFAAGQASLQAQNSAAQNAAGAAAASQAATIGKQIFVQNIQKQLQESQWQLKGEIAQYEQTQQAANAAEEAAHQAQQQLSALSGSLAAAQANAVHSAQAAAGAANAAAAQHDMIIQAKQRVAHLTEEIHAALDDLNNTRNLAEKAAAAAHIAQVNAANEAQSLIHGNGGFEKSYY